MKSPRHIGRMVLLLLAGMFLAACSIVNTTSSEVALQYGGGPLDSVSYKSCTGPGVHDSHDVNDTHYYYPFGQRDWSFGAHPGADSPPLTSVTKDSQQVQVTGTVKFTLNTDCSDWPATAKDNHTHRDWSGGHLQAFHELIAQRYDVAPTDGGQEMLSGWDSLLINYLGAAVDKAADNEALKYNWQDLYTSAAATAQWSQDVQAQIPGILNALTLGAPMIHIDVVLLQKPTIAPALQDGLTAKQAAILRQQAAQVDQQAATSFPGGIAGYEQYQQQQAINRAIQDGKVRVLPVPQGTSVIVGGN